MDRLTQLALDAATGDRDALERFVSSTQGDVWRLCRHLGDPADADDLTQEVFERAIGSIHRFRADGSARSWLLGIARRTCVDHVRRAQRRRRRDGAARAAAEVDRMAVASTDPAASGVEFVELLEQLDPDRRAAFVMTQVLGLRYDEAADALDCPIGTVRSRVARARRDLMDQLDRDDGRSASERATGTDHRRPTT
ncbi:MAG: sigma-70 family RNA polymerase sigma factor [Actinomycetota bacterium]